ncbi:Rne/Rng family ribonuclease [candidate division KSB3 bacterium]|uniref:Ribonuclease G n=1 Tax=candidate division KSB3 bacterium TaxID=2044937 RepID=A0A2G6KHE4_9BACT|nr:MAG: Rne/Rng family ribonuclease [candidate division KSB3 bacterium]
MSQEIIINSTPQQIRVALLEEGQVAEVNIERRKHRGIVGNIYKGRVSKVLPGMQAAFVNIGLKKDAFLYVTDVYDNLEDDEPDDGEGEEEAEAPQKKKKRKYRRRPLIQELLKQNQEIVVQVAKEPLGTKGARVTCHISLPGRYIVFMPTVEHIGVSRRIPSQGERNRLRKILKELKPSNSGFIVRTAGEGREENDLAADIEFLTRLWGTIKKKSEKMRAPALVHEDLNLVLRTVRDLFTNNVEKFVLDSETEYKRVFEFTEATMPHLVDRLRLFVKDIPVFDHYGIEAELEKALRRKVWLKSGGYLVIDRAEALVAIDVNTGKFVGKKNLEDTIVKTNLEAAKEVARQVRLRDLGGIIIVDFIDMENEENKRNVVSTLETALTNDRARTNVLELTELGLVQMTRKRVRESLRQLLYQPCPYCKGLGFIKSEDTICYEIQGEIQRLVSTTEHSGILVRAHPTITSMLKGEERRIVDTISANYKRKIRIQDDKNLHQEQFHVTLT